MEYIILEQQQNTYPTTSNYKKTALDTITLEGNFDTNKLDFDIPTFDPLVIVPDTSFRFLISIEDTIYTSPSYYTELITSYNESNPYFIQSTFQSEFLVKYNLNDIASIIAKLNSLRLRNNGTGQYAGTSPQINISYTSLGQAALVQVFNDLPTVTSKTINITGASGAAALTAPERAIATGKGWTITG